ncbi:DENN domain-containing protein 2D-like isoform X2 [Agrilus planipennis]|nr:DENN domain-containing protein 2D-like isoform X2 [Agrilus planipennis]XP_018334253.1 DENN domain-containing protein 2D-like isoform X2 [Agrilus planipennis]XP_018334254.1 DENN domain-containing protein 2D-like isoform X2 [Agrilus planipennis]
MLQAKSLVNVRDSVHYASCPIPDKSQNKFNSKDVSMKLAQLDLCTNKEGNAGTFDATHVSSSSCTSDMESTISSLSEENGTLYELRKVKDIISVFETSPKYVSKGIKITSKSKKKITDSNINSHKMKHPPEVLEKKLKNDQNHKNPSSHSSRNKRESVAQITKKFEIYVKRVRSKVYAKSSIQKDKFKHLFDCFLLIGLNGKIPYIKCKYPDNIEMPHKIEELCFPDAQFESMDLSEAAQCYSLVITNASGERTYGYCRRVLPEGSNTCLPLVYCIVSPHCAPGFYKKILQELESRHGFSEKFKSNLLNELYNSRFPKPGETIKVSIQRTVTCSETGKKNADVNHPLDLSFCTAVDRLGEYATITKIISENGKKMSNKIESNAGDLQKSCSSPNLIFEESTDCFPFELVLFRHSDTRHEDNNLQMLCNSLSMGILHQVFSSLLLERKVVIVSKVLSKISACVEALQIALYPFEWPHTLIPVLPQCLWEILEAPTPLLCGVLSKQVVNLYKIENGMVVDLDEGSVLLKVGDEDKILRWTLFEIWKDGLSLAKSVPSHQSAHNVLLSDAFLRVFIKSCGHYKQHIVDGEFKKTCFIESGKIRGRGVRSFLTWFSETTMFCTFIETVLKNQNSFHIFDQRIEIYSSEATGGILKKMKENSKEKSSFFRFT